MRLFIAVTPPSEIRALLVSTEFAIERARWVRTDQLHVTLRFLGDVDPDRAGVVRRALGDISAPRMKVRIHGTGTFGRPARILWCGLDPTEEITALAAAIDRAILKIGLPPDEKPFAPHLTLARFKNSPPVMIRRYLEEHGTLESAPFSIDEFALIESKLGSPNGSEYSVLEAYPLAARS